LSLKTKLGVFVLFVSCVWVTHTLLNNHRCVSQRTSLTAVTSDHPSNITWLYLRNLTICLHFIIILITQPNNGDL